MITQSSDSSPSRRATLLALASTAVIAAGSLRAADITWSATTGDFGTATNWTGGVVPTQADNAILANEGTIELTAPSATLGGLQVRDGTFMHNPTGAAGGTVLSCNGAFSVGQLAGAEGTYVFNNAQFFVMGGITIGGSGGTGTLDFVNGFLQKIPGAPLVVGDGNGSDGEIIQTSGFIMSLAPMWIGNGAGATGSFSIAANAAIVPSEWLVVGKDGGSGTLNVAGNASFTKQSNGNPNVHANFAEGNGSTATVAQTGGRFVNIDSQTRLGASGTGTATWTLTGGETVLSLLDLGHADTASGTFNLDGGTLTAKSISTGSTGTSAFNFNGGTLKPGSNNSDFMSGLSAVTVKEFGAIVDTSVIASPVPSYDIGIGQDLLDGGGGLTKKGVGTLTLSGTCSYVGDTAVQGGTLLVDGTVTQSMVTVSTGATLGGTGTIPSLAASGTVAPGVEIGTFTVTGAAALFDSLEVDIKRDQADLLAVTGELDIETATLDLKVAGAGPTAGVYVIATYGTLVGTQFATVDGLPAGYTVNYSYQGNKIAITGTPSPYAIWAMITQGLDDEASLADSDPDGDGIPNAIEFVIGGTPSSTEDQAFLPTGEIVADKFVFTFRRTDVSESTLPVVESSTNLDDWDTAVNGEDGVSVTTEADNFPGGDLLKVAIPLPSEGKLFTRLRVPLP